MADAEIQILIEAIDHATAVMNKIEGRLGESNKQIQKQTEATAKSFDKQMGSLLILGQAANTVDNIFTSYQNLQLRLENATERVTGAQDRLANAQYKLGKVMKDSASKAEDVAEAQRDVESASRALTISQNNLERMQNRVIGTYISIGVQTMTLIAQMPVLIASVRSLTIASMAFIATPLGMALVAIGATIAVVTLAIHENNKKMEEATAIETTYKDATDKLTIANQDVAESTSEWAQALSEVKTQMMGFIAPKTAEEAKMLADIAEQEGIVAQTKIGEGKRSISFEEAKLERMKLIYDAEYATKRDFATAWVEYLTIKKGEEEGITKTTTENAYLLYSKNYTDIKTFLETTWSPAVTKILNDLQAQDIANAQQAQSEWQKAYNIKTAYYTAGKGIAAQYPGLGTKGIQGGLGTGGIAGYVAKKTDFISRPGQEPVSFSSSDTIIGTKNPGGINITITGNIYGTDPDEIAEALVNKLRKKISI